MSGSFFFKLILTERVIQSTSVGYNSFEKGIVPRRVLKLSDLNS